MVSASQGLRDWVLGLCSLLLSDITNYDFVLLGGTAWSPVLPLKQKSLPEPQNHPISGLPKPQNRPISKAILLCGGLLKIVLSRRDKAILLCGGLPNPKIVLSRRDKAILLCGACPNPKIVLSRRDKAILLCGGLPKPPNRPISAR